MIYVLEDDANIRKLVDYALTREGYSCLLYTSRCV